jgi:hypothetical protein
MLLIAPGDHHTRAPVEKRGGDRQSNPARASRHDGDDR